MGWFGAALVLLCGQGGPLVAPEPSFTPAGSQGVQDVQLQVRRLVAACRGNKHPPQYLIRRMLATWRQVEQAPRLTPRRRMELQNMLARRMLEQARRLVRQTQRRRQNRSPGNASLRQVAYRAGTASGESGAAGGAAVLEQDQARQLIELIQRTICPDSWVENGGRGTIYYFAPAKALVVRQRGEIHRELNGLLRQLRK